MLKVLLTSVLISLFSAGTDSKVFICDSKNTVAYHYTKECRGIKLCKKQILEVTEENALKKKLHLCGWED